MRTWAPEEPKPPVCRVLETRKHQPLKAPTQRVVGVLGHRNRAQWNVSCFLNLSQGLGHQSLTFVLHRAFLLTLDASHHAFEPQFSGF